MVRIGIIGIGFMGMIHYYGIRKVAGAEVVAICTRDPKKLDGNWTSIQGNFGPRGGVEDLSHLRRYNRIEDLLADAEYRLGGHLPSGTTAQKRSVSRRWKPENMCSSRNRSRFGSTTRPRWSRSGKRADGTSWWHTYFPSSRSSLMRKTSSRRGDYGQLLGAHFKRVTSKPKKAYDLEELERSGGPGIDLHIHDTHFVQLLCGDTGRRILQGDCWQPEISPSL